VVAPIPEPAFPALASPVAVIEEAGRFIDEKAKVAAEQFTGGLCAHLALGEPANEILQCAANLEADVIVVGTHGKKAVERLIVGSVSQAVVKKARCAVVVARPKDYEHREPEIEPPCPKCLETQRASAGEKLWCAQHSTRHAHGRLHYESPQGYGAGAMFIRGDQQ